MKKFFKDFKAFAMRGNILDMAVGVMIGGAFTALVTSLVNNILTPVIGFFTGGDNTNLYGPLNVNITVPALLEGTESTITLGFGSFIESIINFIIMAFCVFLVVRVMSKIMPKKVEEPKAEPHLCPYCFTAVNEHATRCASCTSELPVADAPAMAGSAQ